MDLKDVSEWTIFIDDVEGELAMEKVDEATGRTIDVLAKEEILPKVKELEDAVFTLGMALSRFCKGSDNTLYMKPGAGGQDSYAGLPHGCRFADSIVDKFEDMILEIKRERESQ